ncbi:hypothetical protein OROMI_023656 [Orobanche minor]
MCCCCGCKCRPLECIKRLGRFVASIICCAASIIRCCPKCCCPQSKLVVYVADTALDMTNGRKAPVSATKKPPVPVA